MTSFELFINTLSHLPLEYLEACSASVEKAHQTTINLPGTSTETINKIFTPLLGQAETNGTSRLELVEYVVEAFCLWRESANDYSKFEANKETLGTAITNFLANLQSLLDTKNTEEKRLQIPSIIDNKKTYKILGLKPSWISRTSRGNVAVTNFFETIRPIYSKAEDVQKMLDEHADHYMSQRKAFEDDLKEIASLKTENESLKELLEKSKQASHSLDLENEVDIDRLDTTKTEIIPESALKEIAELKSENESLKELLEQNKSLSHSMNEDNDVKTEEEKLSTTGTEIPTESKLENGMLSADNLKPQLSALSFMKREPTIGVNQWLKHDIASASIQKKF